MINTTETFCLAVKLTKEQTIQFRQLLEYESLRTGFRITPAQLVRTLIARAFDEVK